MTKNNKDSTLPAALGELGPGGLPVVHGGAGRGMETMDDSVMKMPRAKLLQALSEEVQQDEDDIFKQGMVINSITKEELPSPLEVIPIMYSKTRMHWTPMTDGGGLICQSSDGIHCDKDGVACEKKHEGQWETIEGGENIPPACSEHLNFLCLVKGHPMPIAVTFSGSNAGAGRDLATTARFRGGDLFSFSYFVESLKVTNPKGTFFVFKVVPGGKIEEEEFKLAEQWWDILSKTAVEIHQDEVEDSSEGDGETPDWVGTDTEAAE